jgi:hypothetical protein
MFLVQILLDLAISCQNHSKSTQVLGQLETVHRLDPAMAKTIGVCTPSIGPRPRLTCVMYWHGCWMTALVHCRGTKQPVHFVEISGCFRYAGQEHGAACAHAALLY